MVEEKNEERKKHPGGRPLKYTPEEFKRLIDEYIAECEAKGKLINLVGIICYLDTTRETWREYEQREEFADIIKKARMRCERDLVERMANKDTFTPGQIFIAKNHYGYVDKQELSTPPGQPIEVNSNLKGASEAELQEILRFVRQQTATQE